MRFAPAPGESLLLQGLTYLVQPHPGAPSMAYASEGRRAFVYQLRNVNENELIALKVFKPKFRDPDLTNVADRLTQFRHLDGLKTAERRIVSPTDPTAIACPELQHAMLMPWAQGKTWFDYLVYLRKEKAHLEWVSALHLCERFLSVIEGLERAGIAHTDIAPGNIMIDPEALGVQLIDLEDLYIPGLPVPTHRNTGSFGYRHRSADAGADLWCREGDRYAAGILAAEMLALSSPILVDLATDEGFFGGHGGEAVGRERYRQAESWIQAVAPEFAQRFTQTWHADQLAGCPQVFELRQAIAVAAARHPQTAPVLTLVRPQPSTATWEELRKPAEAQKQGKGWTCLWVSLLIFLALAALPSVLEQLSSVLPNGCSLLLWLGLVLLAVILLVKRRKNKP